MNEMKNMAQQNNTSQQNNMHLPDNLTMLLKQAQRLQKMLETQENEKPDVENARKNEMMSRAERVLDVTLDAILIKTRRLLRAQPDDFPIELNIMVKAAMDNRAKMMKAKRILNQKAWILKNKKNTVKRERQWEAAYQTFINVAENNHQVQARVAEMLNLFKP